MDEQETVIVIFPDNDSHYALLASSTGQMQVYEVPPEVSVQAVEDGLMNYVGMSLGDQVTFDMAKAEMAMRLIPAEISEAQLRNLMLKAMFRFLLQEAP